MILKKKKKTLNINCACLYQKYNKHNKTESACWFKNERIVTVNVNTSWKYFPLYRNGNIVGFKTLPQFSSVSEWYNVYVYNFVYPVYDMYDNCMLNKQ